MEMSTVEIKGAVVFVPPLPGRYDLSDTQFEPGTSVRVTAGNGFTVKRRGGGVVEVVPHWWRRAKHKLTGRW